MKVQVELEVKTEQPKPSGWIQYPDGLKLAAIPHQGECPCPGCGVDPGDDHLESCPVQECPRCGGRLAECKCRRPKTRLRPMTEQEARRLINAYATQYQGTPTQMEHVGSGDIVVLKAKARWFGRMAALQQAARNILVKYNNAYLESLKFEPLEDWPKEVRRASAMARRAKKIWLTWFYR